MTIKYYTESQVMTLVDNNYNYARPQIFDFRAIEVNEEWQIYFSIPHYEVCAINTKREPNSVRIFSKLNGVVQFMKKIGVKEFKVITY
jgi:hypothetical protein